MYKPNRKLDSRQEMSVTMVSVCQWRMKCWTSCHTFETWIMCPVATSFNSCCSQLHVLLWLRSLPVIDGVEIEKIEYRCCQWNVASTTKCFIMIRLLQIRLMLCVSMDEYMCCKSCGFPDPVNFPDREMDRNVCIENCDEGGDTEKQKEDFPLNLFLHSKFFHLSMRRKFWAFSNEETLQLQFSMCYICVPHPVRSNEWWVTRW